MAERQTLGTVVKLVPGMSLLQTECLTQVLATVAPWTHQMVTQGPVFLTPTQETWMEPQGSDPGYHGHLDGVPGL